MVGVYKCAIRAAELSDVFSYCWILYCAVLLFIWLTSLTCWSLFGTKYVFSYDSGVNTPSRIPYCGSRTIGLADFVDGK